MLKVVNKLNQMWIAVIENAPAVQCSAVQSSTDEQQGASESLFRRVTVMECLTLRATVYTDEMLSHNSANIDMQVNNEILFFLADVAISEAKSKSPNCSKDCSSLEMLAAVCHYRFHKVSCDLTHRERLKGIYYRHIGKGFFDLYTTGVVRIFRPLHHVKVSKQSQIAAKVNST